MALLASSLNECFPADSEHVPVARQALCDFAADAGASPEQVENVRLATSEALTNAVLHAYRDGTGPVYVTAALVSTELWVLIADDGCGLSVCSDSPGLGLGLPLIAQASDDFTIVTRATGGTEVRMRVD